MRIACWVTKATDARSEYVILIAFSQQKWLRELASVLVVFPYCLSGISRTVTVQGRLVYHLTSKSELSNLHRVNMREE